MDFTTRHERELDEIKSLTQQLERRTHECSGQLGRIERAQREALSDDRHEPVLAFVHIPKTAGATVISMFAAAYSKSAIRDVGNYFRNPEGTTAKVLRASRAKGRLLGGHTPYGVLRQHLPADTRYMTFLRDPVDRVLSHYWRHIRRRDPARAGRQRVKQQSSKRARAESLEQALVEMRLPEINNLATRFLCGHRSPMGDLPASALDDAKENLTAFEFVGIQERFEESLVLLQRMLGLGPVPYEERHVSSDRPAVDEIPDADRSLIEEHNQLDIELYRFGSGLFEDALLADAEGLAADAQTLRAASAEAKEKAIQNARDWLERELPAGTTRMAVDLRAAAKAAGITVPALMQALTVPAVKRAQRDGKKAFTRVAAQ